MDYQNGYEAENFVMKIFKDFGFEVKRIHNYYDIVVKKNKKVKKIEVKSCNLMIHQGVDRLSFGRFEWSNPINRALQKKNNVYICFVVRIKKSYEIIGMLHSKNLNGKKYVGLTNIMSRKLTRLNKFIEKF